MNDKIKEFYESISLGLEIEFSYVGVFYFVGHDDSGWYIENMPEGGWNSGGMSDREYFNSPDELMDYAKLGEKHLKNCWDDVDITEIC